MPDAKTWSRPITNQARLVVPILVPADVQEEWDGDQRQYELFLAREHVELLRAHRSGVNTSTILLAVESVLAATASIRHASRSFERARLTSFASKLYIERGTATDVQRSLELAADAINIFERSPVVAPATVDDVSEAALYAVVALKALGEVDESIFLGRSFVEDIVHSRIGNRFDVMPLIRQEQMMQQTKSSHERMAAEAPEYRNAKTREYYRTLKRLFEWSLNHGRRREAEALLPELRRAYRVILPRSEPIVRVSFMKNMGQYELAWGNRADARRILSAALVVARQFGMKGQERQILALIDQMDGGVRGALPTFSVS